MQSLNSKEGKRPKNPLFSRVTIFGENTALAE